MRPQDDVKVQLQAILKVADIGAFSADRTIREYADDIWQVKPVF